MKKIIVCLSCAALVTGCNPPPETEKSVNPSAETTSVQKKVVDAPPPIPTECKPLSKQMESINNNSQIKDLNKINSLLKNCVQSVPNKQQLIWLTQSTQMYANFLNTTKNTEKEYTAFIDYGYHLLAQQELSEKIKDDPSLFKKMSPRDQYLVNNKNKAYIDLQYVGEGLYEYRRHPKFLLELFAPHLPIEQREFIQKMALDNQEIFTNDSALSIEWSQLAERALYWEKYIQQYPDSYFIKDANTLFDEYSYYLFLGTDNTPISDDLAPHKWINEDALKTIRQLSKIENSVLAEKANKFLTFIKTPIAKRNRQFDINPIDQDGDKKEQRTISFEQLQQHLDLKTPWRENQTVVDCHTDAVCLTRST